MRFAPVLTILAVLCAGAPKAEASSGGVGTSRRFGLGLGLGAPTSITGKYYLEPKMALDFGLDFGPGFGLHGDALWDLAALANNGDLKLSFYLGVGAQAAAFHRTWGWYKGYSYGYSGMNLAVRVPFGLSMALKRAPFEFFLETGPALWLGGMWPSFFGTLGFRYYF